MRSGFRRRWRYWRKERERSRSASQAKVGDGRADFWKSFWETLNRPFVIFIIGTLAAGTFISVRDASTKCYNELARAQDALLGAIDELTDRRVAFWKEIMGATSFAELTSMKSTEARESRWFRLEFKYTKVDALERKIYQLSERFKNPAGESWSPWEISISTTSTGIIKDPAAFNLEEDWNVDSFKAEDLDEMKKDAKKLIELVVGLKHGPNKFRSFQPKCGFGSSLIRVLTGRPGLLGTAWDD
jgi:hypothetical protein